MPKTKITITVSPETLKQIDKFIKEGRYRNRSHAFEYAVLALLKKRQ